MSRMNKSEETLVHAVAHGLRKKMKRGELSFVPKKEESLLFYYRKKKKKKEAQMPTKEPNSMFGSAVANPKSASKARKACFKKNRVIWVKFCQSAFKVSNAQNHI